MATPISCPAEAAAAHNRGAAPATATDGRELEREEGEWRMVG